MFSHLSDIGFADANGATRLLMPIIAAASPATTANRTLDVVSFRMIPSFGVCRSPPLRTVPQVSGCGPDRALKADRGILNPGRTLWSHRAPTSPSARHQSTVLRPANRRCAAHHPSEVHQPAQRSVSPYRTCKARRPVEGTAGAVTMV